MENGRFPGRKIGCSCQIRLPPLPAALSYVFVVSRGGGGVSEAGSFKRKITNVPLFLRFPSRLALNSHEDCNIVRRGQIYEVGPFSGSESRAKYR